MEANVLQLAAAGFATTASVMSLYAYRRHAATAEVPTVETSEVPPGVLRRMVAPLAIRLRPTHQVELEMLATRLLAAGRRDRSAVDRFCEDRVLGMLLGMVAGLVLASAIGGAFGALLAVPAVVAGVVGPRKLMELNVARRRDAIAPSLPIAVDLLTTCIDAGLSLEHALVRVARELEPSAPVLAAELRITASEFEAGVSLPDALRRLARRVDLDGLSGMCSVIAQAHTLGAPVGQTLREYAISSRKQRTSVLEERAGKLAAQLTLPLAICLLPAAMIIVLGPAVLQLVQALS
jgi:tight adherence protein C